MVNLNNQNKRVIMHEFEFKWVEAVYKKIVVNFEDMEGSDVYYQPTNSSGIIVNRNGELYIIWSDAPDTDLQTKEGLKILTECEI